MRTTRADVSKAKHLASECWKMHNNRRRAKFCERCDGQLKTGSNQYAEVAQANLCMRLKSNRWKDRFERREVVAHNPGLAARAAVFIVNCIESDGRERARPGRHVWPRAVHEVGMGKNY